MNNEPEICDLSNESKNVIAKFYEDLSDIRTNTRKFGCPTFIDKYPLYGEKLGQIKGHFTEQVSSLKRCKEVRNEILNLICELQSICSEIEDTSCALVNSFETEYDCDMFIKGGMYQSKFIRGSKHWSCSNAKEEWKSEYDKCVKLFKEVTMGLNTHNFHIFFMDNGSKAYFGFTVHGVPGDFEVSFPLNSKYYSNSEHYLDSSSLPMQMRLTWRRRWTIPVYDYFFDDFGAYDVSTVNGRLLRFISEKQYMDFCKNAPGLDEEIEASSNEGKKFI